MDSDPDDWEAAVSVSVAHDQNERLSISCLHPIPLFARSLVTMTMPSFILLPSKAVLYATMDF